MQGTCRQDVWIVDGTCMAAYFQDFQFKRASRSHAKSGFKSIVCVISSRGSKPPHLRDGGARLQGLREARPQGKYLGCAQRIPYYIWLCAAQPHTLYVYIIIHVYLRGRPPTGSSNTFFNTSALGLYESGNSCGWEEMAQKLLPP